MTGRILPVLNGDATREPLILSGVPGDCLVWADVLHDGPAPVGVSPDEFRAPCAGCSKSSPRTVWRRGRARPYRVARDRPMDRRRIENLGIR
jgi:hypothetical protein